MCGHTICDVCTSGMASEELNPLEEKLFLLSGYLVAAFTQCLRYCVGTVLSLLLFDQMIQ